MDKQDIVVIGASLGGVEALKEIASALPGNLDAAVFIVLHIGPGLDGKSYLPEILSRAGPLPAKSPEDGEEIQKGRIYIAPPDYHMLLHPGRIELSHGPKVNRTRPAVNPLFRSAASAYGSRVMGVILTGGMDDGVAGLAEIKRWGGLAVVQDPETAFCPEMPKNAIEYVEVDRVIPLSGIAGVISECSSKPRESMRRIEAMQKQLSKLTCPECRGPLTREAQGKIVEYSCRVGHVYTPLAMAREHRDTVERSLWASMVALEEAADIAEALAPNIGPDALEEARQKRGHASTIKAMLVGLP